MVKEENLIPYMKAFYASIVVYNIAVCLTKVSILLQYKRLFANTIMQRLTVFGLFFLSAWAVALAFLLTLICQPVAAFWDHTIPNGRCLDAPLIWYIMAGVNLVTDFCILTLPMPVIKSLQLPKRQKIMLLAVFCLGFFPCAVSIYRIRTLRFVIDTKDPMFDNVDAATWSFLELTTGVLAACLPTLRPIFMAIMPRAFGGSNSNSRYGNGYGNGHSRNGSMSAARRSSSSRPTAAMSGATGSITRPPPVPKKDQYGNIDIYTHRVKESSSLEGLYTKRGGSSSGESSSNDEEHEMAFGSLQQMKSLKKTPGTAGYSVSVVADGTTVEGENGRRKIPERKGGGEGRGHGGIQATTVVTRVVTEGKSKPGGRR